MNKNIIISLIAGILAVGALSSCSKDNATLKTSVPTASFTYNMLTPTSDSTAQNLELINTSTNSMTAYWAITDDEGNAIGSSIGDSVKLAIIFAGTYTVKMSAAGPGGVSDTIQQTITIDKDNPFAVGPTTLLGILTGAGLGNSQRTWMAERVINSVIVWDNYTDCLNQINGGTGAWWSFGSGEIDPKTGRNGYLDDQYTFTFSKVGQFIYNDSNTVFLDAGGSAWTAALPAPWNTALGSYASTNPTTSSPTAIYNLVPALKPWGSGNFTYTIVSAPGGAKGLGQITVNGIGAHIGMPDKANTSQETIPTASSITYDVLKINTGLKDASTGTTYDELILGVSEPGLVWTFMFRSNR